MGEEEEEEEEVVVEEEEGAGWNAANRLSPPSALHRKVFRLSLSLSLCLFGRLFHTPLFPFPTRKRTPSRPVSRPE